MLHETTAQRLLSSQRSMPGASGAEVGSLSLELHQELLLLSAESWIFIYWIEIPLRNGIHNALVETFGQRYWTKRDFQLRAGASLSAKMNGTKQARQPGKLFLDELTLGFWIRFLAPKARKKLWTDTIANAFSPAADADRLFAQLMEFKSLRNGIAHHSIKNLGQHTRIRKLAVIIAEQIDQELAEYSRILARRRAA